MDAKKALTALVPKFDKLIVGRLEAEARRSQYISPVIQELFSNLIPMSSKGKRLRAALVYYSYLMHGGTQTTEILKTATFIEYLHSYLLIHDDVIDRDELRRSEPAVHEIYKDQYLNAGFRADAQHFGNSIAICVGGIMCHLGLKILSEAKFPEKLKMRAMNKVNEHIEDVWFGQALDVFASVYDKCSEEDVMNIYLLKTAKYTYENPLQVGAILAGANDSEVEELSTYALPAGVAYQIQDDILGMFGDEKELGKPAYSDMKEGKQTVLMMKALKSTKGENLKFLQQCMGNRQITMRDLERARKIIEKCGALDYAEELAQRLIKDSKHALDRNKNWKGKGRAFLKGIVEHLASRKY